MVSVDMGSITESLFESEMFGHVKGAFTDAKEDRSGKFEIAQKGTLFLDEIGNLSLQSQAKLLSALQNRYIVQGRVKQTDSCRYQIDLCNKLRSSLKSERRIVQGRPALQNKYHPD